MANKVSYTEAFEELQQIVSEMENSEISVDALDARVKRAAVLLKICKEKLYKTEQNVLESLEAIKTDL
jgi:exodeoxyribonuclease VII small subunit